MFKGQCTPLESIDVLGRGQDSNGAYQSDGRQTCDDLNGGAPTKLVQGVRQIAKTRHQHMSIHQRQGEHNRYQSYLCKQERLVGR